MGAEQRCGGAALDRAGGGVGMGRGHLRGWHLLNLTISVECGVGVPKPHYYQGPTPSAPIQHPMLRAGKAAPSSASRQCGGMAQVLTGCAAGARGLVLKDLGVAAKGGHNLR